MHFSLYISLRHFNALILTYAHFIITKRFFFFILKGASVNLQSCEGSTALSEACKHGHRDTVGILLKHHADANKDCKSGLLPLHIAAQYGHEE